MQRNSSRFRHRMTIQARSSGQGDYGQPVEAWVDLLDVWCSIKQVSGRELQLAGSNQTVAQSSHLITCRWPGFDILPTHRCLLDGKVYHVTRVSNVNELDRFCEVGVSEILRDADAPEIDPCDFDPGGWL